MLRFHRLPCDKPRKFMALPLNIRIEVKQSRVAAWSKTKARGLWLKGGYKIKRGMIIGVYGGKITNGVGPYVLQLEYDDGQKFRVDTEGGEDGAIVYGMMNEDIHEYEVNAHF